MTGATAGFELRLKQSRAIPLDAVLECEPGQLVALVGPSGSGKSTILRAIAGLYRPRHARICCNGKTWVDTGRGIDWSPQRRQTGFVFQNFALFPHLNVLENVSLAVCSRETDRKQRLRVACDLLERVNLAGLDARLPHTLSGGQQQRVALARALAREPAILLLDEPFSAVDQVTRRKLRLQTLQLTRDLNIPIILVTHDLDEAEMLADRMCVLHDGRTLQSGTPAEIFQRPDSKLVARLVDIQNLFEGRILAQEPARDITRFSFLNQSLEAAYHGAYSVGDPVCWCIPPSGILLHSRVNPSAGIRENPLQARILECITVGGLCTLITESTRENARFTLQLPVHVVERNGLRNGDRIGLSLLRKALHLMPHSVAGSARSTVQSTAERQQLPDRGT